MPTGTYPRTEQQKHNQSLGQCRYYSTPEGNIRRQIMSDKIKDFYLNHPEARQRVAEQAKGNTNRLGSHSSELTRKRQSQALKGKKKPPLTEEQRARMSKAHLGLHAGVKHPFYGKHHSLETIAKLRANHPDFSGENHPFYGKSHSPETRIKIAVKLTGMKASTETRAKMSLSRLGEKNCQWLGGKSCEPYTPEFNEILRNRIRARDNYTCQLCGVLQNGAKLDIHHIDYDKKNTTWLNLITLCRCCNAKANHNRCYWQSYFTNYQSKRS